MVSIDAWDLTLLALVSYAAVMTLVRLMQWRRDAILDDLSEQIELEKEQQRLEKKRQRRKQLQDQAQQAHTEQSEAA